jgi:TRAP-type C4-dicarboxylate transport system permease small subunit
VTQPRPATSGSPFSAALDGLYLLSIWSAGLAILLMSLIIPWGVFMRYVLGTGSQWPEPIAILLMMVFTFVGAAAAYRAGSHIAVDMFTSRMPAAMQRACVWIVDLLMAAVCLFVIFYGTRLCIETWHQSIAELPWLPVGVTYAALPIGSAITLLFVVERMFYGSQAHRPAVAIVEASGPGAVATS